MVDLILRVLGLFGPILRRLGVDNDQFRAIVEVKATLDQRRPMHGVHGNRSKPVNKALLGTVFFYGFAGIFPAATVVVVESPMTALTLVNSMVMVMIGMILVADFTNVLVDTTDNAVLLPRPVSGRTILVARVAHILSYLALLSLSLSAITLIAGAVRIHPLFPLLYLVTLASTLGFVIFMVHIFYLVAMRIFDMEKFRDLILYIQIALTVGIFASYQILPRLIDFNAVREVTLDDRWWIYLCPPAWMAAPFDLLAGHIGPPQIILSCLAVVVPVLGVIVVIRVLAPGFNRSLAALEAAPSGGGGMERGASPAVEGSRRSPSEGPIARLVLRNHEERAAFDLFWPNIARDRSFKLATYPSVAMIVIMTVVFLFLSDHRGIGHAVSSLPDSKMYLFILYFSCALLPNAFIQSSFSDRHEASWAFRALPVERPGALIMAAFKVVLLRFAAPLFAIIALMTLFIWGPAIWADILLASSIFISYSFFCARLFGRRLPFSMPRGTRDAQGQTIRMIGSMMILSLTGLGHWLVQDLPFAVPALALAVVPLIVLEYRRMKRTRWADIGLDTLDGVSRARRRLRNRRTGKPLPAQGAS